MVPRPCSARSFARCGPMRGTVPTELFKSRAILEILAKLLVTKQPVSKQHDLYVCSENGAEAKCRTGGADFCLYHCRATARRIEAVSSLTYSGQRLRRSACNVRTAFPG